MSLPPKKTHTKKGFVQKWAFLEGQLSRKHSYTKVKNKKGNKKHNLFSKFFTSVRTSLKSTEVKIKLFKKK